LGLAHSRACVCAGQRAVLSHVPHQTVEPADCVAVPPACAWFCAKGWYHSAMKTVEMVKRVRDEARRRGIRWTNQRQTIIEIFSDLGEHITAEELHRRVREVDNTVSTATVYRTVNLLVDLGVAEKGHFGGGSASFEMALHKEHHDHLICLCCQQIIEFHHDGIEGMQQDIATQHGFALRHHRLELYGVCPTCQAAGKDSPHPPVMPA